LKEAISSVIDQTHKDFEFIIVDDGSRDGTRALIEAFADSRIRLISLPVNRGLVHALNVGLSEARGTLIARMDADDICLPTRLELQAAHFLDDKSLAVLGTSYTSIDPAGRVIGESASLPTGPRITDILRTQGNCIAHPTVMMRKDLCLKVGGYRDLGGRYAQDYDLWLRMAEIGRLDNLATPLLNYRVHDKQVSFQKFLEQTTTAEFYRLLALQRLDCGREGPDEAWATIRNEERRIRNKCVSILLDDAVRHARRGKRGAAFKYLIHAIKTGPTTWALRHHLGGAVGAIVRGSH
jgi:glycosyltransferase involved in cell wall biosynthesis